MRKASFNGIELEFEERGSGEPVMLIHGSAVADAHLPLMAELASAGQWRMVRYHRRGYAASTHPSAPIAIADQAADCLRLMRHLGIGRAHVVGHSYGGAIALQLALDAPAVVHSLGLLEPALVNFVPEGANLVPRLAPAAESWRAGDKAEAVRRFLDMVCGAGDHPALLNRLVPGSWEMTVADADTLFQVEVPAMQQWSFSREAAARIKQPVLSALGADSELVFRQAHELVLSWMPQAEPLVIAGSTHMLQMLKPREVAQGLAAFFARHPIKP